MGDSVAHVPCQALSRGLDSRLVFNILYCSMCILITIAVLCGVDYLCVAIDTECTIMLVLNTYLVCLCYHNHAHPLQGDSYDVDMIHGTEIRIEGLLTN